MSVTELADVVGYSKASMSRFETCDSPVPEELCPKLDAAFGTNGLFTALFEMLRGVRFPDRYLEYMGLENDALSLGEWAGLYVPGLLQTPAYARALFRKADLGATDEELDVRVAARMGRRHIFDKECSYFTAIIDQAVLHRRIGGAEVMRTQLESLLPLVDHEHGMIRVLPYRYAEFGISDVTQIVIELEDVTVVYVEGGMFGQIVEDPDIIRVRRLAYDRACAYALAPRESAAMICAAIKEYEACSHLPT